MNPFGLSPGFNLNDVVMGVAGVHVGLRVRFVVNSRWVAYAAAENHLFCTYGMRFPMDSPEAIENANDKLGARARLEAAGLRTLPFQVLDTRDPQVPAEDALWTLKVPHGKQGSGVLCRVPTEQVAHCAALLRTMSRFLILEPTLFGPTYRFLVLDGQILDAHITRPPSLVGDGRRTILELMDDLAVRAVGYGITVRRDVETSHALQTQGLSEQDVLPLGKTFYPTFVSNITRGGSWAKVDWRTVAPDHGVVAAKAATAVGLRLCGVDLMESLSGDIHVLEANPSPGIARFTWEWRPTFAIDCIDLRVPISILKVQLRSIGHEISENVQTIVLPVDQFASIAGELCVSS